MPNKLYGVKGTVTRAAAGTATAVRGAKVWAFNQTSQRAINAVDDYTYAYTDVNGRYILEISDVSGTLTVGDTVLIMCQCGDDKDYALITVTSAAGATQNFTFANKTDTTDAIKDTRRVSGKEALNHSQLRKGCKDAMN